MKRARLIAGLAMMAAGVATAQVHGVPPSAMSQTPVFTQSFGVPAAAGSPGPRGWQSGPSASGNRGNRGGVVTGYSPSFTVPSRPTPGRCINNFECSNQFFNDRGRGRQIPVVAYYPSYYPAGYLNYADTITSQPDPNAVAASAYDQGYNTAVRDQQQQQALQDAIAALKEAKQKLDEQSAVNVIQGPAAPRQQLQPSASERIPDFPPDTVLVFKDHHKVEIHNYAIIGNTLYEIGDRGSKRISLAELDIDATLKANNDRGIQISLPASK